MTLRPKSDIKSVAGIQTDPDSPISEHLLASTLTQEPQPGLLRFSANERIYSKETGKIITINLGPNVKRIDIGLILD